MDLHNVGDSEAYAASVHDSAAPAVSVGSSEASSDTPAKKDPGYCWITAAYQGAFALSTASMLNQLADSEQLGVAASLVQTLGSSSQTYSVNLGSINPQQTWTIGELITAEATAAGGGHTHQASVYESAIGQAQSEQTQNVQIAQQFSTQETNVATSTDPQTINQTESEMSNLNSSWGQWAQICGPISA